MRQHWLSFPELLQPCNHSTAHASLDCLRLLLVVIWQATVCPHDLCFCKVVLIGVPGAFTPTCSLKHLPGFLEKADELKSKGVDTIACVAVNDAFVMDAWSKSVGTDDKIMMLADGSADFTKVMDLSHKHCFVLMWVAYDHSCRLPEYARMRFYTCSATTVAWHCSFSYCACRQLVLSWICQTRVWASGRADMPCYWKMAL